MVPAYPGCPGKRPFNGCSSSSIVLPPLLLLILTRKPPSRGRTGCYLFTVSNSGLLSMQREPVDHAHRHRHIPELTSGFNSSIDVRSKPRKLIGLTVTTGEVS